MKHSLFLVEYIKFAPIFLPLLYFALKFYVQTDTVSRILRQQICFPDNFRHPPEIYMYEPKMSGQNMTKVRNGSTMNIFLKTV